MLRTYERKILRKVTQYKTKDDDVLDGMAKFMNYTKL
jgi:hypothetical protein